MPHNIGDHPDIANALATGYPRGCEPQEYYCPVCGRECETLYRQEVSREIVGCDVCIDRIDPQNI